MSSFPVYGPTRIIVYGKKAGSDSSGQIRLCSDIMKKNFPCKDVAYPLNVNRITIDADQQNADEALQLAQNLGGGGVLGGYHHQSCRPSFHGPRQALGSSPTDCSGSHSYSHHTGHSVFGLSHAMSSLSAGSSGQQRPAFRQKAI